MDDWAKFWQFSLTEPVKKQAVATDEALRPDQERYIAAYKLRQELEKWLKGAELVEIEELTKRLQESRRIRLPEQPGGTLNQI